MYIFVIMYFIIICCIFLIVNIVCIGVLKVYIGFKIVGVNFYINMMIRKVFVMVFIIFLYDIF